MASSLPLITLEEHFCSPEHANVPQLLRYPGMRDMLTSLSERRIADMDAGRVSRQVISHTPMKTAPEPSICRAINDKLFAAVHEHPDRFSGFAVLPMHEPEEAARELRRTVEEFGFVGALVENHVLGKFYDGNEWDVLWEEAIRLDVPIYLHPSFASEEMMEVNYRGNYDEEVASALGASLFGWHTETGLHFLRLFVSGLFDRHPKLKIILGHMGEAIPFFIQRQARQTRAGLKHLKRDLMEVWRENIWVTTSGMFDTAPLECVLACTPLDHVLFSVDYPFSTNQMGAEFVDLIEKKGVLKGDDLRNFASGNAEKLLKVKA